MNSSVPPQTIQLSEANNLARFNFKRLANELDQLFVEVPEAESQAARLLKSATEGPLRVTRLRRLKHMLKVGGPAYAGATEVKPLGSLKGSDGAGSGSLKPPSSSSALPKGKNGKPAGGRRTLARGADHPDEDNDLDVAGRLSRLLIERFGVKLPKVQVRDFDSLMGEIRRRLRSGGSSMSSETGEWQPFGYPPYGYPPYGGYAPYPGQQLYAGSMPAPPAQDLLMQHQVRPEFLSQLMHNYTCACKITFDLMGQGHKNSGL